MKNLNKWFSVVLIALAFAVSSCSDEGSQVLTPADVIIINEGNFNSADGTLSTYSSVSGTSLLGVFTAQNGFPLAATIQNVTLHNGRYYAVTNNVDKVEVFNPQTLQSLATIQPGFSDTIQFANPFSFAAIGNKGYVSNWGTLNFSTFEYEDSFIAVLDLSNNTVVNKIDRDVQPQHLWASGDNIYIADVSSNTVSVLSSATDQIVTTIDVPSGPDRFVADVNQKLWVICRSGALVRIDPSTNTVEQTINGIQTSGFNEKMAVNGAGDQIYYLSSTGFNPSTDAIYSFSIDATTAPDTPLISGQNFYALGVHPIDGDVYIGDANAFQSNGTILRHQADGTLIESFPAGRGPNGFLFE